MKKKFWRIIHFVIIVSFLLEIAYGLYMVFWVHGSRHIPLFAEAAEMPIETILRRRLYAVETWIAMSGLCIYLAITEILPGRINAWKVKNE